MCNNDELELYLTCSFLNWNSQVLLVTIIWLGFRKVDHDRFEYAHEGFLRGRVDLLKTIKKKRSDSVQALQQQPQRLSSSVGACVEVGKLGLQEDINILKRDKEVLVNDVVMLGRQQQSTCHQLQTLGQRLQGMELRQQQMVSFLANAIQSPGFLAQLVQQQNVSNRRIAGVVNKKRRLPMLEDNLEGCYSSASDGQIIKYQLLLNEAAQAMLMQLNLASPSRLVDVDANGDSISVEDMPSPSHRLDAGTNGNSISIEDIPSPSHILDACTNGDSISFDDIPSPSNTPLDSTSTSNWISGVTLSEVAPTSGHSLLSVSSTYSGMRPSAAISGIQSSAVVTDTVTSPLPDISIALEEEPTEFPQMQDIRLENQDTEIPGADFADPWTANEEVYSLGLDGIGLENEAMEIPGADFVSNWTGNGAVYDDSFGVDDMMFLSETGDFLPDFDVDMLSDGYYTNINDPFLEQSLPTVSVN
ncbi:hypothetical protein MKW94_023440 [Papaver nudicaule]|uniref:Uncharacterized protein n=1 Tax=Papaver nudicaule TaxID=74823 RepID=A0AA41VKQ0_PAPNU|nr:hypothetical protein [Papaver nudicaule]